MTNQEIDQRIARACHYHPRQFLLWFILSFICAFFLGTGLTLLLFTSQSWTAILSLAIAIAIWPYSDKLEDKLFRD